MFLDEVLKIFSPRPGQIYVDATVNGGGHARAIAERVGETGRVIGIDLDPVLIGKLRAKNEREHRKNIELTHGNYGDVGEIVERLGYGKVDSRRNVGVDGILFDLGFSSYHVDESGRGFSFRRDEPLDMRYDPIRNELTAEHIVNTWSKTAIEDIIRSFGEERYSRRIAARITAERRKKRIRTTTVLARIIQDSVPVRSSYLGKQHRSLKRIHPATRTFQALRIAVNDEFGNIERGMESAVRCLGREARIIVISFHSLEDRIIKNFFQKCRRQEILTLLTPKPVRPSLEEVRSNPRARSAKLRAGLKI